MVARIRGQRRRASRRLPTQLRLKLTTKMGPITLFDKSFLQSLSLDEAVWFDAFYMSVVCPIFYVETLADLAKVATNRTADAAVRIIAQKTPELSGGPCAFHAELAVHNLLGNDVPMDGRIPRGGGRYVTGGGRTGVVYDESPEMKAFARWQDEQFSEVERLFAAGWRTTLGNADLNVIARQFRSLGVDGKRCTSLEQASSMAQNIVAASSEPFKQLDMAVRFFDVPREHHRKVVARWEARGQPALSTFAPYAAYVLTIEMFFHISVAAKLISSGRPSNRTDIAYLFYLPFCMMFVSNDKLHRRTASLFLRPDQQFVWGPDLKSDLGRLNAHYLTLPEAERNLGVTRIAKHPPTDAEYLTTTLWRRWMSDKMFSERSKTGAADPGRAHKLVEEFRAFTEGETLSPEQFPKTDDEVEAMTIKRRLRRRKGAWYLLPKDLPSPTPE